MLNPSDPSPFPSPLPTTAGSRRRRLWDLASHAHCPVVGVCLPMPALRRLLDKAAPASNACDDYERHCIAVSACKQRNTLSEALQRELERRFAATVRRCAANKTEDQLQAWWQGQQADGELAAALWAVLTHARCSDALTDRVLGQVHMLQHQLGMATRVELDRFEALIDENAVLARQLAAAQQRHQQHLAAWTSERAALESQSRRLETELLRARAELAVRTTEEALVRADAPAAPSADELSQLRRQLANLSQRHRQAAEDADHQRRRAEDLETLLASRWQAAAAAPAPASAAAEAPLLQQRSVLCVGGRAGSVPAYRALVERCGGRFMHHDGGDEDHIQRLDSTLAAADLVICQTGCISHDAYWRVKDHCKRTGKRCLFVASPSRSALQRALVEPGEAA